MKHLIIIILICCGISALSFDVVKDNVFYLGKNKNAVVPDSSIATFSIKARLVQTLAPYVKQRNDTGYIRLLNKWVEAYNVPVPPSGATLVSVDSVPIIVIAHCYRKCYSYQQGALPVGSDFAADVAAIRASNHYIDELLDAIDDEFSGMVADARAFGRIILTGKTN